MKHKVKLFEKLYLAEDGIEDIPPIQKLIKKGDWDGALELAKNLNTKWNSITITMKKPLDNEALNALLDTCKKEKIDVKGFNGDTPADVSVASKLKLSGTDETSSNKLATTIDQLEENGILPKNRTDKQERMSNTDAQVEVLNQFADKMRIRKKVTDDGNELLMKINSELGLNDYDNPFIGYLQKWNSQPLTKANLIALNNLYADYTIDESWLNGNDTNHNILLNKTVYRQLPSTRELTDVIHKYANFKNNNTSENWIADRDKYFINPETNYVYNYSQIIKNLGNAKKQGDVNTSRQMGNIVLTDTDVDSERINVSRLSDKAKANLIKQLTS